MDFEARVHAPDTTAPWPPASAEESGSFRWLRPGELLAIPVPTMALELDALLRHIEIDAELHDWPAAAVHLAQARATWRRLEPALGVRIAGRAHLRDARKAARLVARALERAERAATRGSGRHLLAHVRSALAQVDAIERAFE